MTQAQIRQNRQNFLKNAALLAVFAAECTKRRQKIIFAIGVRGEPSFFIYVLNPLELRDPDGRASGFITQHNGVPLAGHSAMYVERYDASGASIGFTIFEVRPVDTTAKQNYRATVSDETAMLVGGLIAGPSGASMAVAINRALGEWVGVNEYEVSEAGLKDFIQKGRYDEIKLGTSMSQDNAIYAAAKTEAANFKEYDLLSNNCGQYASRVLSEGGVNTTSNMIPNIAHDYIKNNNPDLVQ